LWAVPYRGLASWHLAFSPDGRRLAGAGHDDPVALLWDVPGGLEVGRYAAPENEALDIDGGAFEPQGINHLILSPDGELAAGMSYRIVRLWDAASGAQQHVLNLEPAHQVPVTAGAFSPDGRLATGHDDGSIRVWDTGGGTCERVLPTSDKAIGAVAFSADGTELVAVSLDQYHDDVRPWAAVRVWDLGTGECRRAHTVEAVADQAVRLAADGSLLAQRAADGTVQIWDIKANQLRSTLDSSGETYPDYWDKDRLRWRLHGFSPDGTRLAASDDGDSMTDREGGWVRVWDTTAGEVLFTVRCHLDAVTEIAFSSDNAVFATSCDHETTTQLWDGRTGAHLAGTEFPMA
jgi:WD40 repeat protein